jgi:hypothetical protein
MFALIIIGCAAVQKQKAVLKSNTEDDSVTKLSYKDIANVDKYVLTIEDSNYVIAEDSLLILDTPHKTKMRIKLKKEEYNKYSNHGISFDYSNDMKVEEGNLNGITMIKLNGSESFFIMLQILPPNVQPEAVLNATISKTKSKFSDIGINFEKELDVKIENGNGSQDVLGKRVLFASNLIRIKQEDYIVRGNNNSIFVLVQMSVNKSENLNDEKVRRLLTSIQ